MLRCAKCGKENLDDALSCRECAGALSARDFDKGTTPPSASAPTAAEEARDSLIAAAARERATVRCPHCGESTASGAEFCPNCDRKLITPDYASFGRRAGGYVVDVIIIALVATIPASIVAAAISPPDFGFPQSDQQNDAETLARIWYVVTTLIVSVSYIVLFNALGGTLGKRVLGMRLEKVDTGENIGYGAAIVRFVVSIASGLALGIGYLWAVSDEDKQTWHDKAAMSVVMRH